MTSAGNNHLSRALRLFPALAALAFLLRGFSAGASENTNSLVQYGSRTWQTEEGLPQNVVQALAQTREGYLWVGTPKGLSRFDGARFTVFDPNNTPELKNASVTALCEDRNGTLWIGTAGGGLTRLKDGRFTNFSLSNESRGDTVKSIFESADGALWIGTLGGLFRWSNGVTAHFTDKDGLLDNVVRSVCENGDTLWIATGSGLNRLRRGIMANRNDLGDVSMRTILRDHEGNIWMGWVGGLICFKNGQFLYYTKEDGLADNNVGALYEDRRGELWVGTYGGLSRLSHEKFTIEKDSRGGFYDQINAITEDQEGDIWIGGRDGLQQLRVKRFTTYTRLQDLSHNNIMSVLEDREGGIWMGTWGGGLCRLLGDKVMSYNWENSQSNGLMTDLILGLCEDTDGSILIGTDYEGGTFRFNEGKFTRIWSQQQATVDRVIRVIYRDREGNLWFGDSPGLVQWNTREHWLDDCTIRCILEDDAGTLWVGATKGLFMRKDGKFERMPVQAGNTVVALHADSEHNLWIGTAANGLSRYRDGKWSSYTTKQGLFSDDIFEILEDDHGWLWMSSSRGIYRVSKENLDALDQHKTGGLTCIAYGKADGLETLQCNGVAKPSGWKSRDGRLWFATAKGLAVTDPNQNRDSNTKPPTVLIEEVIADKQPLALPSNLLPGDGGSAPLQAPAGRGDLEFHFTALSLQAPEKDRFKYMLEGIDSDWTEVTRRAASYKNLRPGKYQFHVMACNNDGVWNRAGATVGIELLPHFWQTWWFATVAVVLFAGVAGGGARFFARRNLRQELQRLEQQHAIERERIRIAQDMHDEIGAKLTKISFLGAVAKRKLAQPEEVGRQIDRMSQTARDVIRALDEIVWAVNPANDSLEDLATYLCRNAAEFFTDSPIACQFNIPAELPACRLGTHVRHNMLLATKEALNNVLKHSGATQVHVQISDDAGSFEVLISDNGRGFNAQNGASANGSNNEAHPPRVGNGLSNMRQRLEAIGGRCRVESRAGQGTTVAFSIRLDGDNHK